MLSTMPSMQDDIVSLKGPSNSHFRSFNASMFLSLIVLTILNHLSYSDMFVKISVFINLTICFRICSYFSSRSPNILSRKPSMNLNIGLRNAGAGMTGSGAVFFVLAGLGMVPVFDCSLYRWRLVYMLKFFFLYLTFFLNLRAIFLF